MKTTDRSARLTGPGRYYTLDGIRGVAAIYVVIGHSIDTLQPLGLPRFWLAVDLFFLISGFVLGRTYEPRFASGMTAIEFIKNRYIRLYPLYAVGLALGAASALVTLAMQRGTLDGPSYLVALISGALLLPSPTWGHAHDLVPLNFPAWSLIFELIANVVFAVAWRRLTDRVLVAIVVISLAVLLSSGSTLQFGGESWASALWGFPRIGFSFFLGLLMQRRHRTWRDNSLVAAIIVAVPALIMSMSQVENGAMLDLAMLAVIAPLIVWIGAAINPARTGIFTWLGDISYPMYIIHIPLLSVVWRTVIVLHRSVTELAPTLGLAYLGALVLLSTWLDRYLDRPVRRSLVNAFASRPIRDARLTAIDRAL